MSENINFIPANSLPEAEGNEVSVLCLENGELKQKVAKGLGGSDTTGKSYAGYDLVFANREDSGHELLAGSYAAVTGKLIAGEPVTALVVNVLNVDDRIACEYKNVKSVTFFPAERRVGVSFGDMESYSLYEDDSIKYIQD